MKQWSNDLFVALVDGTVATRPGGVTSQINLLWGSHCRVALEQFELASSSKAWRKDGYRLTVDSGLCPLWSLVYCDRIGLPNEPLLQLSNCPRPGNPLRPAVTDCKDDMPFSTARLVC